MKAWLNRKFDFNCNKTENPPKHLRFKTFDLFISFMIGYIDGDGSISKQSGKRTHAFLRIQCHSSWKLLLNSWFKQIHELAKIDKYPNVRLNKRGYAYIAITNSKTLQFLKDATVRLNLPVLNRKWDLINGGSLQ